MTVAIETLAGTNLAAFRESMAKVGIPVLLGKVLNFDCTLAGETTIAITATAPYLISRIVYNTVSGAMNNDGPAVRTATAGGGTNLGGTASGKAWGVANTPLIAGNNIWSNATLYARMATDNGAALVVSFYVFGYYVPV